MVLEIPFWLLHSFVVTISDFFFFLVEKLYYKIDVKTQCHLNRYKIRHIKEKDQPLIIMN